MSSSQERNTTPMHLDYLFRALELVHFESRFRNDNNGVYAIKYQYIESDPVSSIYRFANI
jgi:hypothetical protein